jgi:hypothetical protein
MLSKIKMYYLMFVGALTALGESVYLSLTTYMARSGLIAYVNLYSQRTYDAALLLKAAALVGASANGTLILDVGGGGLTPGMIDADLVVDVTALEIDSSDESYDISVQGSPDATFATAGNIVTLGGVTVGHSSSTRLTLLLQGTNDVPGRFIVPIRNEKNGTTYRYLRIRTVVVGTVATGINYTAWLAKDE